jgi:hypothetical protein
VAQPDNEEILKRLKNKALWTCIENSPCEQNFIAEAMWFGSDFREEN